MAVFKCKMCGGALEISGNETVATCDYCGVKQTVPTLNNDRKVNLYDRANHFRRNNEFDKAMGIYEQVLNEDDTDAEAYWSLVLCRYGIEYVEDPVSHKRVPTVNRAQYTSVFDDVNYKSALQHADPVRRVLYEEEAAAINEIQKGILAISQKEEPFDVFICYKETDQNGRRTPDSVLANDLYHQLVQEGFKVFFARITLEDKLGTAYEPYIFAALNSAKVMVVLGTNADYFNAVWVKNEWSRYLALIKNGAKKILIPAYKDMDPYDLPEEFSHLQAQDMSKLGFMQDLIRGIKKLVDTPAPQSRTVSETVVTSDATLGNVTALLKRGYISLEDGEWQKADEFFEQALNQNAELAQAYLGKLMAQLHVNFQEDLMNQPEPFDNSAHYQRAYRFGDQTMKAMLEEAIAHIRERNENSRVERIYKQASFLMKKKSEQSIKEAASMFECISDYKDAATLVGVCMEMAEEARREAMYIAAKQAMKTAKSEQDMKKVTLLFEQLGDYQDSVELLQRCYDKVVEIHNKAVYDSAMLKRSFESIEKLEEAVQLFESISSWKDADEKAAECKEKIEKLCANAERKKKNAKIRKVFLISFASLASVVIVVISVIALVLNVIVFPMRDQNKLNKALQNVSVGDYIKFGKYEQDGNVFNGKEDIEWLVLDVQGDKALVISKYILDYKQWNKTASDVEWTNSSLCQWLNNNFAKNTFSATERKVISAVTITDDFIYPGDHATNKIFVLSKAELDRYFASETDLQCQLTQYAKALVNEYWSKRASWWLRTKGAYAQYVMHVTSQGDVERYGRLVNREETGVRPAMWIDLK